MVITSNPKQDAVSILISDKADNRTRNTARDKEEKYIKTKGPVLQEVIIILIVLAPNNTVLKYMS